MSPMCGRYALYGNPSRYQDRFATIESFDFGERFNIAPSSVVPVVKQEADGTRHLVLAKWGLVPAWCKDPKTLHAPINAMAETAAIKPMFRSAFRKSRVLVPADAFYEWQKTADKKVPHLIRMKDQTPFGMAGLLEHWRAPSGEDLVTFTILTTDANPLVASIHNRMPVIVAPEHYGIWLDPEMDNVEKLQAILTPFPERLMEAYPIGTLVNSPRNDRSEIVEPSR